MEFAFTPEQELIRKTAREFAEEVVAPRVAEMEKTRQPPLDLFKALGERGFLGITVPTEHGGLGLGYVARTIAIEEISRISPALGYMLQVFALGMAPILDYGSEEQKRKFLPDLVTGDAFATVTVTEATGGTDPRGITSTAEHKGDHWVLNGRKVFITGSSLCKWQTITAISGQDDRGRTEISAFLVSPDMEGCRPGREEHKMGLWGTQLGELVMENCIVPEENLLLARGKGLRVALTAISETGRSGVAAVGLGVIQRALEESAKFANERVVGGSPIGQYQGIQFKIADMALALDAARLLCYRACWLKDQGERCDVEMAKGKLFATEAAMVAARHCAEIHGGYGWLEEYVTQQLYRDAAILIPSAGTSESMRIVIGRSALAG
ncbi:MAG: acyl-CoA dehydrogenase family protein [Chloroflexia bacterium]|nr:acyl-CoA dehydrogenase family protein [Chloroflexia bacterium]